MTRRSRLAILVTTLALLPASATRRAAAAEPPPASASAPAAQPSSLGAPAARPPDAPVASASIPELQARLVGQLAAERDRFVTALNAARAAHTLPPLRPDPRLDETAQAHAAAVLGALRSGQPLSSVPTLASRITERWRDPGVLAAGAGGSAVYADRTNMKAPPKLRVGEALVVDALDADQALATALSADSSDLLVNEYARVGVGIAFAASEPGPHVVWVACLMRR